MHSNSIHRMPETRAPVKVLVRQSGASCMLSVQLENTKYFRYPGGLSVERAFNARKAVMSKGAFPEIGSNAGQGRRSCVLLLAACALALWYAYGHGKHAYSITMALPRCQSHLKQIGLAGKMYASDQENHAWPELAVRPGVLAMRAEDVDPPPHPEYLTSLDVLQCPAAKFPAWWLQRKPELPPVTSVADDRSYFYLGYYVPDQETLERFAQAYRAHRATGAPFTDDLPDPRWRFIAHIAVAGRRHTRRSGRRAVGPRGSLRPNAVAHRALPQRPPIGRRQRALPGRPRRVDPVGRENGP